MRARYRWCFLVFFPAALFTLSDSGYTQQAKNIFADPQNLKVLDEKISPQALGETMKGFALGLGLRCENCHVGEAGKPLSTFDFSSDDKPMKQKARLMLEMVKSINSSSVPELNKIEDKKRTQVRCVTCHRGQQKPLLIQDMLATAVESGQPGAASAEYKALRQQYYGSHTFDFSEPVLPMFAQQLMQQQNTKEALDLLVTNAAFFPDSFFGQLSLAKAYESQADTANALKAYRKAFEINPRAVQLKQKINELSENAK